jgi:hypothetical protein
MKLDKKDATTVTNAIKFWENSNKISPEQAQELRNSIEIRDSNIDAITWYAFVAAVSCGLLAFGALVIDEKWIELLRRKWGFSETIVATGFTLLTGLFVFLSSKRSRIASNSRTSNETYNTTIVLSVAIAITYWTRSLSNFYGNYATPLMIATVVYAIAAIFLKSTLLWSVMLVSLAGWWGAQTHYWAHGSYRFGGMNYPLRMTVFGLVVLLSSILVNRIGSLKYCQRSHYAIGLLFFLLAAWTLSIFGNYDDWSNWSATKQSQFWYWALGFTLMLAGLIAYAFKTKDDLLRDICLIFFLLNIYTRYFEYFWDKTNKGIFFSILALSFWWVGKKAEQWLGKHKTSA